MVTAIILFVAFVLFITMQIRVERTADLMNWAARRVRLTSYKEYLILPEWRWEMLLENVPEAFSAKRIFNVFRPITVENTFKDTSFLHVTSDGEVRRTLKEIGYDREAIENAIYTMSSPEVGPIDWAPPGSLERQMN